MGWLLIFSLCPYIPSTNVVNHCVGWFKISAIYLKPINYTKPTHQTKEKGRKQYTWALIYQPY